MQRPRQELLTGAFFLACAQRFSLACVIKSDMNDSTLPIIPIRIPVNSAAERPRIPANLNQ
jgi:hypothetical protein